jgi:hypothetical protein
LIAVPASWAQYAPAGLAFTFTDDGTDTTVNWSGTLNTGGLTVEAAADTQAGTGILGNTTTIALMESSPKLRFNQPFASSAASAPFSCSFQGAAHPRSSTLMPPPISGVHYTHKAWLKIWGRGQ